VGLVDRIHAIPLLTHIFIVAVCVCAEAVIPLWGFFELARRELEKSKDDPDKVITRTVAELLMPLCM
jgi:hypothetical protein